MKNNSHWYKIIEWQIFRPYIRPCFFCCQTTLLFQWKRKNVMEKLILVIVTDSAKNITTLAP